MSSNRGKVLVAMSGGVDSSVAAALLVREGYEVVGCFMRLGSPGETLDELVPDAGPPRDADTGQGAACRSGAGTGVGSGKRGAKIGHQGCCSINDAADARLVAAELGIPFYVCNFKKDFGRIIDYFVDEYAAGRTPNPCVRCNDWLKFGKLHEYALQIGADFVASGHYARVERHDDGTHRLCRGVDESKDQSYVLFGVPGAQLGKMMLPIGGMRKPRVRELAAEFGLPVFDKPDSQEICFVPDNDYAGLVESRRPELTREGKILDEAGRVVGTHEGQHRYTIGQRRGVGVAFGHPIYVVGKDAESNTITVGERAALRTMACVAGEANWLVPMSEVGARACVGADGRGEWLRCRAKYRYNTPAVGARARVLDVGGAAEVVSEVRVVLGTTPSGRVGRFEVEFDEPQNAVAPGQAVVLYGEAHPEMVLGGGWIESARGAGR